MTGAKKYDGAKVPIHFRSWNESSLEQKFSGTKFSGANVPYWELSLLEEKVPKSEKAMIQWLHILMKR